CSTAASECAARLALDPLRPDSEAAISSAIARIRYLSDPVTIRNMTRQHERSAFGAELRRLRVERGSRSGGMAKACKEAGKAAPLWGPQPAGLPAGGLRKREERCAPPHETRDRRRVGGACGGAGIREHSLLIGSTRNADGAAVTSLGDSRRQDHIGEQATN